MIYCYQLPMAADATTLLLAWRQRFRRIDIEDCHSVVSLEAIHHIRSEPAAASRDNNTFLLGHFAPCRRLTAQAAFCFDAVDFQPEHGKPACYNAVSQPPL